MRCMAVTSTALHNSHSTITITRWGHVDRQAAASAKRSCDQHFHTITHQFHLVNSTQIEDNGSNHFGSFSPPQLSVNTQHTQPPSLVIMSEWHPPRASKVSLISWRYPPRAHQHSATSFNNNHITTSTSLTRHPSRGRWFG